MENMIISLLPILVLIVVLMLMKRPAWQAALAAYVVVIVEALVQGMPLGSIAKASLNGAGTGLFPIGLVIIAALFVYNVVCESGHIEVIKSGLAAFSPDMRFAALMVAWGFGNFMEGMAGFGTAVAIPCAILVGIGMDPFKAVLCCLVANTTPTAFGSVGVPSLVLASEAEVDILPLSRCIATLEFFVTALSPFFILLICDGWKGIREKWGLALLADIAFLLPWTLTAFALGCELPNILGGICVMLALGLCGNHSDFKVGGQVKAWSPFIVVVALLGISSVLPKTWRLPSGVIVLCSGIIGAVMQGLSVKRICRTFWKTLKKYALAVVTICIVLSLAKVMGAAGMIDTIASGLVASVGSAYPFFAPVVGALGGFITGSGTSSNVLFGSLQSSIGADCGRSVLYAAANIMGAGIGKMICPQSIVLGCAASSLSGNESKILTRALPYFIPVLLLASVLTYLASGL